MSNLDLASLLARRKALSEKVLVQKAGEYATAHDRLHNFRRAQGILPFKMSMICDAFLTKHLVSLLDLHDSVKTVPQEVIDEKIGDSVNYIILKSAIIHEENGLNEWPCTNTTFNENFALVFDLAEKYLASDHGPFPDFTEIVTRAIVGPYHYASHDAARFIVWLVSLEQEFMMRMRA